MSRKMQDIVKLTYEVVEEGVRVDIDFNNNKSAHYIVSNAFKTRPDLDSEVTEVNIPATINEAHKILPEFLKQVKTAKEVQND